MLDDLGLKSQQVQEIFLISKMSKLALEPIQAPVLWVPGFFPQGKRPRCESDHSPPPSVEVKNEWSYTSTPPHMPSWHRERQVTFYISIRLCGVTSHKTVTLPHQVKSKFVKNFIM
jgi:hypothetical protein